jgi:CheY-like chemotaxis protein
VPIKILMVDDEPDAEMLFRQNFRREIRKGVYEFLFAQSGQQALDLLASDEALDLLVVLSDINMPGMTGVELLETVKSRWPDLQMMMITAYGDVGTEESVTQKGARQLVSKPVDFAHLKSELLELAEGIAQ